MCHVISNISPVQSLFLQLFPKAYNAYLAAARYCFVFLILYLISIIF